MKPKRLISLLVAVCMMITMLPLSAVTAFAEDTSTEYVDVYRYEYKVDGGNATITQFWGPTDGHLYAIDIPTELGGHTVTAIGNWAFAASDYLQKVTIPQSVTSIGEAAFLSCHKLDNVTIPENVTSIGTRAFDDCTGLRSLTIKGVATSIGEGAFAGCTLTSLSLVGSFQTIGDYAFTGCGMTSLTINANITSIGEFAFSSCNSLTSLSLTGNVQEIGVHAFSRCNSLTSVSLTGNVQKIGDLAFYECSSLYTAILPENLTSIGSYAFESCTRLHSIEIPGTVTKIGDSAFSDCDGLISATIDEGVQSTGTNMFNGCDKLTTVNLPESLTTIADGSFASCSKLNQVKIPARVTCIGDSAFSNCTSLSEITLRDGVKTIGADAFSSCQALTSITLPDSVTEIGQEAFRDAALESITIPENVTAIKPDTFKDCSKLEYIMLPAGLTSFQDSLKGCPAGDTEGAIYYKNYTAAADALLADNDNNPNIDANDKLRKRNFLYLCKVTFDANGGTPTDYPEVSVYKTEKIKANDLAAIHDPTRAGYTFTGWYTEDDQPFDVNETAIMEDTPLHAGWEFDPNALGCHSLTVTGGTVTVKYDDSDVTNTLTVTPDEATGKKTYSVPDGATVTVTLDKTAVPKDKVFDSWSTGNLSLTGQDYKAESITFTMNSDVDIAAQYRDAATDHTHDTAVCHPLTLKDGVITSVTVSGKDGADPEDITEIVKKNANEDGSFHVPEGATVSVAFDKDAFADSGLKFGHWDITGLDDPNAYQNKESFDFEMPVKAVTLKAMTQDASIEDDEPDIVGPIVIGTTVVVGGAVLGYQAYSLGAEFAGKLMALPYFPSNRSALAMMLWEDAGKPMPESELLYPDVGQEERDMDLQHAARWAMENELIPDLNDEGTAPEEMKFFPANPVSKLDVLNAWQKAQELKNN